MRPVLKMIFSELAKPASSMRLLSSYLLVYLGNIPFAVCSTCQAEVKARTDGAKQASEPSNTPDSSVPEPDPVTLQARPSGNIGHSTLKGGMDQTNAPAKPTRRKEDNWFPGRDLEYDADIVCETCGTRNCGVLEDCRNTSKGFCEICFRPSLRSFSSVEDQNSEERKEEAKNFYSLPLQHLSRWSESKNYFIKADGRTIQHSGFSSIGTSEPTCRYWPTARFRHTLYL